MKRASRRLTAAMAIVGAVCLSLVAMLAVLNRKDETVGLKQEIQYDDFAFSVEDLRSSVVLPDEGKPNSTRWLVKLKIANHAKRVDFTFKRISAVLVDDHGREFLPNTDVTNASAGISQCSSPIPAGTSCTTELAYDLPEGARVSTFRISDGGRLGDILDLIFYGKKRISLGSLH